MKELTYADKTLLMGDDAADTIIEFSALLAEKGHADAVTLNALSSSGEAVVASFVLGSGTNLMATSAPSPHPEPENEEGVDYMREHMKQLTTTMEAQPDAEAWPNGDDLSYL